MGAVDHIGIGVSDLVTARRYFDGFMPLVGFTEWFPADEHQFNYGPDGEPGTQVFFYRSHEGDGYRRHGTGLQHLAFGVPDRSSVEAAHAWAVAQGTEVVHEPREFPEYGEHCYATFVRAPDGIELEVVTHAPHR